MVEIVSKFVFARKIFIAPLWGKLTNLQTIGQL